MFLNYLSHFQKEFLGEKVEFICSRNMAPQYGLKVKDKRNLSYKVISESISNFVNELGFYCKVEEEDGSIVLSISADLIFQKKYTIQQATKKFSKYGFEFFPIEDHHSGSHFEDGSLVVINSNDKFNRKINKFIDKKGYLNYLNFHKLITEYFLL